MAGIAMVTMQRKDKAMCFMVGALLGSWKFNLFLGSFAENFYLLV